MAKVDPKPHTEEHVSALEHGREALSAAGHVAGEQMKTVATVSREKFNEIKKKSVEDLYQDAKTYVRENPGKSLLGGIAAGFLLGLFFRRS